jgi:hypothetical protein
MCGDFDVMWNTRVICVVRRCGVVRQFLGSGLPLISAHAEQQRRRTNMRLEGKVHQCRLLQMTTRHLMPTCSYAEGSSLTLMTNFLVAPLGDIARNLLPSSKPFDTPTALSERLRTLLRPSMCARPCCIESSGSFLREQKRAV